MLFREKAASLADGAALTLQKLSKAVNCAVKLLKPLKAFLK